MPPTHPAPPSPGCWHPQSFQDATVGDSILFDRVTNEAVSHLGGESWRPRGGKDQIDWDYVQCYVRFELFSYDRFMSFCLIVGVWSQRSAAPVVRRTLRPCTINIFYTTNYYYWFEILRDFAISPGCTVLGPFSKLFWYYNRQRSLFWSCIHQPDGWEKAPFTYISNKM